MAELYLGRLARAVAVLALALAPLMTAGCGGEADVVVEDPTPVPASPGEQAPLLAPPAPEDGIQITMSGFEVPATGETEVCRLVRLPNDTPIDIAGFEVAMPEGSHHFAVWSYHGTAADEFPQGLFKAAACIVPRPADSMNTALLAGSGSPSTAVTYPDGIGFSLPPGHPVLLNAHYVNTTDTPFSPTVYVNLYYAKKPVEHVIENLAASNFDIFIPPGESRTSTARWRIPFDMYFLSLSSHMHKRGDQFTARIVEGYVDHPEGRVGPAVLPAAMGAAVGSSLPREIVGHHLGNPNREPGPGDFYHADDWEQPTNIIYDEPRLFPAGTVIEFSCTQHNDKDIALAFGVLAEDEMCILTGLYYRGPGAPSQGTRIPGCLPQAAQLTCGAEPVSSVIPGPQLCGDGRREAEEECDLGGGNGSGNCTADCKLDLPFGTVLGPRRFPVVFAGPNAGTTDFLNSVTSSSAVDSRTGVVSDGALLFTGGPVSGDGTVVVSQDADVKIGLGLLGGAGATCIRIAPTARAGAVQCRGGGGVGISAEVDNADRKARSTDTQISFGGGAGGPGSAAFSLNASIVQIGGPPSTCLTRSWSSDPVYPLPFTTGTSTGTITSANGVVGNDLIMSRTGEGFDCARWSDENGPGILQAVPFLSPNTGGVYAGDVIAQLTLAGRDPGASEPEPEPPTEIGGEFAAIVDQTFASRCALPSCHSSVTRAGNLVLERDQAYDQLVGQAPDNAVARAAGLLRVAPGDPDTSFIVHKLTGELDPGEGDRMPSGNPPLPEADIARIRDWIAAGAAAK